MIKIIAHDLRCPLLLPTSPYRDAFELGIRKAAARIFAPGDRSEVDLADVKMYRSHFYVPFEDQSDYDLVVEVELSWSEEFDPIFRERSIILRTAIRELAYRLGFELTVTVWGRIVRTEWITDEVPDTLAVPGQLAFW